MLTKADSQGNTNVHLDVSDAFTYAADGTSDKRDISLYEPAGAIAGLVVAGVLFKKKTGSDYALTLVLGGIAGYIGGAFLRTFLKKGEDATVSQNGNPVEPIKGKKEEAIKPANSEFFGSSASQEKKCPDGYYWSTDSKGRGKCFRQPTL